MLIIPSTSREYIHVPVSGATADQPVELAVVDIGAEEPAEDDWVPADVWDGSTAKLLIGPGGTLLLADGAYRVWVRVTAEPEIPVLRSGLLRIT
ncbi:hypothetical protein [Actinomadura decatromicini]|uniref:Uncharacterized protein n=1 Tax=Actinomadura decatromicini TaxID=2604572 RepID=A0A5D3F838_9ACTN|nr:hypothetical protein [Actinomadura decatromicini]TYK45177.1 hypothetical protein FXF68_31355 [Actinomadura decatromicini]